MPSRAMRQVVPGRLLAPLAVLLACAAAEGARHSLLFGAAGELWARNGRLPDFSRAGYRQGESPIPRLPQTLSVSDFGAKGDGITDDTQAFLDALAAVDSGALFVPAGRYRITRFLEIRKSGVVLRGAGPDRSVLVFPKGMEEIDPKPGTTSSGTPTTRYSFDFAFLTLQGDFRMRTIVSVTAIAKRGDSSLQVSTTQGIAKGRRVFVRVQEDGSHTLKKFLYSGDPGDITNGKSLDARMAATVMAVEGNRLKLDRPLRFETRPEWKPEVVAFDPTVTGSGVEDLGFEFPDKPYLGHFKELGMNAVEFREVADCWVRNLRIHNADMGVLFASYASFNTATGVVLTAYAGRGTLHGHHAFQFKRAYDNLAEGFDLQVRFVHDLSVENASGNVYAGGRGLDLCFDHHKDTPFENLYTDLNCGAGKRVWANGGGAGLGRPAAGWSTFWNLRADAAFTPPPAGYGPASMNVIGFPTDAAPALGSGVWVEPIPPSELMPPDLRKAQLALRTGVSIAVLGHSREGAGWAGAVLRRGSRGGVRIGILPISPGGHFPWFDLQGRRD